MQTKTGLSLSISGKDESITALDEINQTLREIGARVWPIDLSKVPREVTLLLNKNALSKVEEEHIKNHFHLSRERLLQIIKDAGREPHVKNGGALETIAMPSGTTFPCLFVVKKDEDYSRFDKFHINASKEGVPIDEVMQMLSGRGYITHQQLQDGTTLSLRLDCPHEKNGWLLTYSGGNMHIGSLSHAEEGTKILVDMIGPKEWWAHF